MQCRTSCVWGGECSVVLHVCGEVWRGECSVVLHVCGDRTEYQTGTEQHNFNDHYTLDNYVILGECHLQLGRGAGRPETHARAYPIKLYRYNNYSIFDDAIITCLSKLNLV